MHLPQQQRGIQLIGMRIGENPLDCPRAQVRDHVQQIGACFGEGVLRDIWPRARVPLNDTAVLEMPETRNEERSRDAGQTPLEFVEVAAAKQ
jgi:hypothetical protein